MAELQELFGNNEIWKAISGILLSFRLNKCDKNDKRIKAVKLIFFNAINIM